MNTKILLCLLVLVAIIELSEQEGGGRKTTAATKTRRTSSVSRSTKRTTTRSSTRSTTRSSVTSDLTKARINGLNQHNLYRNKHSAQNLQLDDGLNIIAQTYADYLVRTGLFQHSNAVGIGENLYKKWDSAAIDVPSISD
jgi:uncharacterized protein YkwD